MSDRDSDDDEHDELEGDEEEEESPPPPKAKPKASASKASGTSSKSSGMPAAKSAPPAAATMPSSSALMIGVVALAIGGAVGWFGHIQKAKAALKAEVAAAPVGSGAPAGPCGAFQTKICSSTGEQSASCQEAKGAADLLASSTCEAALGSLPETLAKVKAGRASCEKLVTRLCADLTPGSKTCDMVKERTPSFPRERCDAMMQSYDKVIAELKQMDEQGGGMQMGGGQRMPPGMPPGGMPPGGMPPGASPHGGIPRITIPQSTPAP